MIVHKLIICNSTTDELLLQHYLDTYDNKGVLVTSEFIEDFDIDNLIDAKLFMCKYIVDAKTQSIIYQGFDFDGHIFSLSDNAQRNWIGIAAGIAVGLYNEQTFPFPLSDTNDQAYNLKWEDRFNFLGKISYVIGKNKTIGTGLKQQILNMTTPQELAAFKDNR